MNRISHSKLSLQ
jgi:hypothetical protein